MSHESMLGRLPQADGAARPKRKASPSATLEVKPATKRAARPSDAPKPQATLPAPDLEIASKGDKAPVRVYIGDCRERLAALVPACKARVDLIFADPPFNWNRAYDEWDDSMPREDYLAFTRAWLDLCRVLLRPGGAFWVNIPDDTAAEIVCHLKQPDAVNAEPALDMINWCIWHYRFGQNTKSRFINSKVHALYFVKPGGERVWNADEILEVSDRRAIYGDPRTESKKDGLPAGLRVPMDVWYGQFWGRIQGNNAERRANHDNQLPEVYLERVVRACSNAGDLVLDPFLGSGTTGVVAHALGRSFIGCEFSKANAESAMARIKKGPARPLGQARGMSTAIFKKRGAPARPQHPQQKNV